MSVGVVLSSTPAGHAALRAGAAEATAWQTDLVVLHVLDTSEHASDEAVLAERRGEIARLLAEGDASPEWTLSASSTQGDLASAIIDLVEETGVERVVIGTRRRSAVGKLLMGSTVQRVLLDSPVPVLLVKA